MKFLVLTDLHQKTQNIDWINSLVDEYTPDAVLFLGDATDLGTTEKAVEIISAIKGNKLVLPGNCDPRNTPAAVSEVATDVHGKSAEIGDVYIAGLGGGNISPFNSPFELGEDEIYDMLKPISRKGMVLMTHAPGFDILDHIPSGVPVGSKSIRKIIEEFEPVLALSGHIHEDIGVKKVGNTVCVNPGPAMDRRAAFITVTDDQVAVKMIGPDSARIL